MISWISFTSDGLVETATVGNEGFNGVPVLLGAVSVPGRSMLVLRRRIFS
jgi:hypothetical protein